MTSTVIKGFPWCQLFVSLPQSSPSPASHVATSVTVISVQGQRCLLAATVLLLWSLSLASCSSLVVPPVGTTPTFQCSAQVSYILYTIFFQSILIKREIHGWIFLAHTVKALQIVSTDKNLQAPSTPPRKQVLLSLYCVFFQSFCLCICILTYDLVENIQSVLHVLHKW